MAIPKQISFVTFDVYGNLIDSDTGAYDAFEKEADRDGFTIERDELVPLFHETQKQIQAGSYELYCPVDGHKGQGMDGAISVASATGGGTTTNDEMGETTTRTPGY